MLEKIYIYKQHDYEGYDAFCQEAADSHLEVISAANGTFTADGITTLPDNCICISDSLDIIQDTRSLIGLGKDFDGDVMYVIESFDISMDYVHLLYDRLHNLPHTIAVTEHLLIREMTIDDLNALYELYNALTDCPYVEPLYNYDDEAEFTRNYIDNMYHFFQYGLWLVYDRATGRLIGRAGLEHRQIDGITRQELGYIIHPHYQRRGLAREACRAIIRYAADELCLKELFVCSDVSNVPSLALAAKLGFTEYASDVDGYNIMHLELSQA